MRRLIIFTAIFYFILYGEIYASEKNKLNTKSLRVSNTVKIKLLNKANVKNENDLGVFNLAEKLNEMRLCGWWKLEDGQGIKIENSLESNQYGEIFTVEKSKTLKTSAWKSVNGESSLVFNGTYFVTIPKNKCLDFSESSSFAIEISIKTDYGIKI
jgi:hypothetical protein